MSKKEFNAELTKQGLEPRYSGKNKTFYINQFPDGNTLADIERKGFKVEKLKNNNII